MHKYLTLAALLVAVPVMAQTPSPVDHSKMQGMDRSKMSGMNHGAQAKPGQAMPPMDHSKMQGMDQSKMGGMGEIMKNTPANPYAEAGMAMHHKMMVVGTDPSETWTRQMIEHHRGGIAMSKIALDKAQDKDTLANARKLIAAQDREIGVYQAWLKSRGKTAQ